MVCASIFEDIHCVVLTPALQSEIEETLKRIQSHKGVIGIIIVNSEGIPIRSTLDNNETAQYAALVTQLAIKAKSTVRDLDPQVTLSQICCVFMLILLHALIHTCIIMVLWAFCVCGDHINILSIE